MKWTEAEYAAYLQRQRGETRARARGPEGLSEKAFMAAIVTLATMHGWKVFHPFDSRRSIPGYPDLTLAKADEPVVYIECKLAGEKPTIEQQAWLATLRSALHTEVYLWYPEDWPQIEARLTQPWRPTP